jgi:ABC-type methionine transport system ATPase subunit
LTDRNVERNLAFVLEATGHQDKAEIKSRIEAVLDQVGMANSIHKRVHKLSGGEQQRIAIARALLNKPVLILAPLAVKGQTIKEDWQQLTPILDGISKVMAKRMMKRIGGHADVAVRQHPELKNLGGKEGIEIDFY